MTVEQPIYFDFLTHARNAGLGDDDIAALVKRWGAEYGNDRNLLELRLLRICRAIEQGRINLAEALGPDRLRGEYDANSSSSGR